MNARVLVVDNDDQIAKLVAGILAAAGYEIHTANEAEAAIESVTARPPALVLTDLEIPGMDGIELCRHLRKTSNVPIIVMSGRGEYASEVSALDAGADDYVVKPLVAERLVARVRAALRRSGTSEAADLGIGEFHIDFAKRRVVVNGQPVRLTPKEFDLFVYMARHPNRVLPRRMLLAAVWGEAFGEQHEYLRVFMAQLRKKLEADPANPRYLVTEPWVGYCFNPTGSLQ